MRMTTGRSFPVPALLAALLLTLLVAALVVSSIRTTRAFIAQSARVAVRDDALHELERLLGHLEDAEDANRGYLLTADDDYLDAYQRAEAACGEHYGRLLALTVSDPERASRAEALRPLIDARLAHLRRGIALMAHDPRVARADMEKGEGKALMDRLRAEIDAFHRDESGALTRDDADVRHLAALSETLDWSGGSLALATIAAATLALQQQWRARSDAEQRVRDANERLERQVEERTAELARANQELESFSSTVSHDLRAPLRVIEGLSRLVRKRAGAEVDQRIGGDLELLEGNVRKMRALVDDLLAFSRLGRGGVELAPVAMRALVDECWAALALERGDRRVELVTRELPTCRGDAALLRQVLMNLLGNAIKYTRPREAARIEVGGAREGELVRYTVRDNGVGFDMGSSSRLFEVFSRLHGDDQFEGTGIGLATVRRIIDRHGGRIWAEGAVDRGAAFHFTLPAADAASER
jgi:signal transduction histidine kinase